MKDKFVENGFDFINEAVREEIADEERFNLADIEREHFEEDEY